MNRSFLSAALVLVAVGLAASWAGDVRSEDFKFQGCSVCSPGCPYPHDAQGHPIMCTNPGPATGSGSPKVSLPSSGHHAGTLRSLGAAEGVLGATMGLLEMIEEDDAATTAPTPPTPIPGPPTPRGWWSPWQLNGGMPSNAAGYIGEVSGNAFVFQSDYVVGCSIPDPSQAGCLVVRNRGTNNLRIRADGMVICTIIPGSYCAYPLNVGQRHLEAYIVDDRAYVADRLLATSDPDIQSQGHEWKLMDQ